MLTNGDSGEPSQVEGYPMRAWSIEIFLLDENGQEVTANCFEKATYNLHPSFEKNKQGTLQHKLWEAVPGGDTVQTMQDFRLP